MEVLLQKMWQGSEGCLLFSPTQPCVSELYFSQMWHRGPGVSSVTCNIEYLSQVQHAEITGAITVLPKVSHWVEALPEERRKRRPGVVIPDFPTIPTHRVGVSLLEKWATISTLSYCVMAMGRSKSEMKALKMKIPPALPEATGSIWNTVWRISCLRTLLMMREILKKTN